MFSQLFSKYLVDKNVISEGKRAEILEKQSSTHTKMGTIAVAEKMLTPQQAEELNALQVKMDKRFGDLAVEKGYLTNEDIEKLLKKQGSAYVLFIQLAEEVAGLSCEQVDEYLNLYREEKGYSEEEMEAFKKDDIDKLLPLIAPSSNKYITLLVGLVLRNLTRFVTSNFYTGKMKRVENFSYEKLAGQRAVGKHTVNVGFADNTGEIGLATIARKFANVEYEEEDDVIFDAVGEFINCVNGLFAIELGREDVDVDMEPPVAYEKGTITGSGYVLPIIIEEEEVFLVLSIDSELDLGNTKIELNLEKEACSTEVDEGKKTVLIVDDSKMSRMILRNILEENNYHIIAEAVDGVDGIEEYKKYKPDIVTLDVTMPKMDGIEALQQIMDMDKNAKVMMVTAAGQQKRIIEALKIGAKKFVTKPYDEVDILKNIATL